MYHDTIHAKKLEQLKLTVALGIRALVLKNINKKNREEFISIAEKGSDDDLFIFGRNYIPDFDDQVENLLIKIQSSL